VGNFNEVLHAVEHEGVGTRTLNPMQGFREAVDVCNLLDLGYKGHFWTWEKKVTGGTYTRVRPDCALGLAEWSAQFPLAFVTHIDTVTSDHSALHVQLSEEVPRVGNYQFRYETTWERHENLKPTIAEGWASSRSVDGLPVVSAQKRLTSLAHDLGRWGSETFGSVHKEIKNLKLELSSLRSLPGRVGPSHRELKINEHLVELYHHEEIMWKQRSRIEWLSEGDKNSKFFHQRASMRKRKNLIKSLTRADGQVIEDKEELMEMTSEFYKNLYTSEGVHDMHKVLDHVPRKVTTEMNDLLTAPYTREEVKKALFQMFPTKAPGPGGFPAHFFQRHWDICGEEITKAVLDIVSGIESAESINDTILVLIPKVKTPTLLPQFRPISLCNVFYKISS
jgi:hypothetical protein